jgi:translation initiation factor 1 (eIF-1/SUI1)
MEQERQRLLADDRQKHLLEDSARLVQLSNDLKAEVDKSGKFVTSVTAIRDAEEIEKLAHSLRDRLKN